FLRGPPSTVRRVFSVTRNWARVCYTVAALLRRRVLATADKRAHDFLERPGQHGTRFVFGPRVEDVVRTRPVRPRECRGEALAAHLRVRHAGTPQPAFPDQQVVEPLPDRLVEPGAVDLVRVLVLDVAPGHLARLVEEFLGEVDVAGHRVA